jgi:OOP family OmpA-OmpF porin
VNGFEDDDGCPDEKPQAELKIIREEPLILEGVNFEYDSARLEENSKRILDLVYRSLNNNPEVEVKISGHTDAIASEEYNLDLSRRRAESVKRYLAQRGIAPDRIETEGYGESQPIATNETPEGRAQNRRIEIIRID